MKVLIIADNLGNNAPGVVFRNILAGLSKKMEFDLISSTPDYTPTHNGNYIFEKQSRIPSWRVRTSLFKLFGFYHTQKFWAKRVQKYIKRGQYDTIISLMSSTFYSSLMAADMYARKHHVKHICYCVDAVPAPYPWETDEVYSNSMKRLVKNYMQTVDTLCMTNKEMLDYEVSLIGNENIKKVVLPNPPKYNEMVMLSNENIEPSFAYAGKIYGVRNPDALLQGFSMFVEQHPDAKLYFIGSGSLEAELNQKDYPCKDHLIFIPYTRELESIYSKCIGLVDVNANIDNDVFLSSKVISYLPYNRMIISESGKNSPVRNVFKGATTVLHVSHSNTDIFTAMCTCYKSSTTSDYSERLNYISTMSMESACRKIMDIVKEK